jgi:hypothetical protein
MKHRIPIALLLITTSLVLAGGCASKSKLPATRPSASTARPAYWNRQPGTERVEARDFDRLWRASEETARDFGFELDRLDYRNGVITTVPLTSKQFFEVWRNDVATIPDMANSSLATYRRTLRFDIEKTPDGRFAAVPRVVVERYARAEQPITSSVYLRNAFRTERRRQSLGTRESDRGVALPRQYWYATGRDEALEENVARRVQKRLTKA